MADTSSSWKLDDLIGATIHNTKNKRLGEIDDVVASKNQIQYVLVSYGGFLGLGEEQVVVPWQRLRVAVITDENGRVEDRIFVLNMSEKQLEAAPRFKKGDEKWLRDEDWQKKNLEHYGNKRAN